MFRLYGLLTGSGLLAATMWLANMTSAQDSPFDAPAGGGRSTPSTSRAPAASNPFAAEAAATGAADVGRRRVDDYLQRARKAQQQGDKAQALLWATAADRTARELKLTFRVGETTPAQFIAQLQGRPASGGAVAAPMPAIQTAAAAPQQDPQGAASPKDQAAELLRQAREEMAQGHYGEARTLALQAGDLDVSYDLFEDQPQFVLAEVERLTGETMIAANDTAPAAAEGPSPFAPEPAADVTAQQQSDALMADAAIAFRGGNYEGARALAEQAAQLGVEYSEVEQSPAALLAAIDRAEAGPSDNPFAPGPVDVTSATAEEEQLAAAPQSRRAVHTAGMSALDLYNQGIEFLRQGDRQSAFDSFQAAYQTGEKLDPYRQQQLRNKLRELDPRRNGVQLAANEEPANPFAAPSRSPLDQAAQEHEIKFDRLRTDVMNAIFRAERDRETDPQHSIEVLDQALQSIANSGLSATETAPLTQAVNNSRTSIDAYMNQRAPLLQLERDNNEVRSTIEREIQNRVRVEQDLAMLVEQYNELMNQKRYKEAHVIAQKAMELDPENPVVVQMNWQSKFGDRNASNERLKNAKEETIWRVLDEVDWASTHKIGDGHEMDFPDDWNELSKSRKNKYGTSETGAIESEEEIRVRNSLNEPVSLHFEDAPLDQVMRHIAQTHGINVVVDQTGLEDAGATAYMPVTINIDGIKLKSALNLILKPLNLDFAIEDEVLKVTSALRQQGEMKTNTYSVPDLVTPLTLRNPNSVLQPGTGYGVSQPNFGMNGGAGQYNVNASGGLQNNGFAQVVGGHPHQPVMEAFPGPDAAMDGGPAAVNYEFDALTELITTTIEPDSWVEYGGSGSITRNEQTLSLVIRQTQRVHDEIRDLLDQLRRLQDLQVTIEVRFISVSDRFFERIGIDFDWNVNDSVGGPRVDNNLNPLAPFGAVDPVNGSTGGVGTAGTTGTSGTSGTTGTSGTSGTSGTTGTTGTSGGTATANAPFAPGPLINLVGRDNWNDRTVVGLLNPGTFSPDLDIPFRQGSFAIGVPDFGGFQPESGLSFGMAILSDIEAFLFVQAAQGDSRSNIMFAPKITVFNGIPGTITSQVQRPFVISLQPVVSAFSVGFQPIISVVPEGVQMTVQAVVSADRRYVRLSLLPFFTTITDVFTFSFVSGVTGTGAGGFGGGVGGLGGGGFGGGVGGGLAGFGGSGVSGGTTGTTGTTGTSGTTGTTGTSGSSGAAITVQQPVVDVVSVTTVVSVPDGGTVLLGGIKRLREGRNMDGVPILNKLPYISRLFKNTGVGRETDSLMLLVTPRIIIQEEEEELLGTAAP